MSEQTTQTDDLKQKVLEWAKNDPKAKKYLHNYGLCRALYAKNNTCTNSEDIVQGMNVELDVFITDMKEKEIARCSGCFLKECNEEQCGLNDMVSMIQPTYTAFDINNEEDEPKYQLKLKVPPKSIATHEPLELEAEYSILGWVQGETDFNNKKYAFISLNVIKEKTPAPVASKEDVDAVLSKLTAICEAHDGEIPESVYNNILGKYNDKVQNEVILSKQYRLTEGKDGKIYVPNS